MPGTTPCAALRAGWPFGREPSRIAAITLALTLPLVIVTMGTARAQGAWQIYQYDSLGNLVGAWDSAGRNAQFRYDPADNRTQAEITAGVAPPAPTPPGPPSPSPAFVVVKTPTRTVVVPHGR